MSVTAVPLQPVKRGYVIWLWLGIVVAVVLAVLLAWQGTRAVVAQHLPAGQDDKFFAWHKGQAGVHTTASGLQYMVLQSGSGPSPVEGDIALVEFEGKLRDGTVFQPKSAAQGWRVGEGIPGFAEAIKLMRKGSRYRFWIPGNLAYGANPPEGARIPVDAMLIFDVGMLDFISEAEIREMQARQMQQQQMMPQPGAAPDGGQDGEQLLPEGGTPAQ